MTTNRFFNFKRFYHLLSCDLRLNRKRYLFTLAGGFVIFYLILFIDMSDSYFNFLQRDYTSPFFYSLLGLGAFIGSAFPELSSNVRTGNYLLLPASTLEKVMVQLLIYFVCGCACFLLIFWMDAYLVKWTVLSLEHIKEREIVIEDFQFSALFQDMTFWDKVYIIAAVFSTYLLLFASRLFFKRFALVKSTILLAAIFYLFVCYMMLFSYIFYPEAERFGMELPQYFIAPNMSNILLYGCTLTLSLWPFLLPLAYYKLKEKHV